MTKPDPNAPVEVGEFRSELEASFVVQQLEEAGIKAWTTGALTAGMRAEAPGFVRVYVRAVDAEAARGALREDVQD
ncbi:MAG: DUF2007 domain-containing protein [Phycisphaerales bacterium]